MGEMLRMSSSLRNSEQNQSRDDSKRILFVGFDHIRRLAGLDDFGADFPLGGIGLTVAHVRDESLLANHLVNCVRGVHQFYVQRAIRGIRVIDARRVGITQTVGNLMGGHVRKNVNPFVIRKRAPEQLQLRAEDNCGIVMDLITGIVFTLADLSGLRRMDVGDLNHADLSLR